MAFHSPAAALDRRPMGRLAPLLVLSTFAALLIGALTALPAAAHSTLLSATPEDGAELDEAPEAIVLTFNEDITDLGTDIVVTGPDGEDATGGDTEIDGAEVSRPLAADLPAGEYAVTWRAVSADGHPIDGESTFTVAEGAAGGDQGTSSDEGGDEASPSEDASATEDATDTAGSDPSAGEDSSQGDEADADASDAADAQADPGTDESAGTSGGQVALFVVIGLAVVGGVAAVIVRMRRRQ